MAKIKLPESWAGVAEPLRALIAEVERETHADNTTPDLAAVSASVGTGERRDSHDGARANRRRAGSARRKR